MGGSGGRAERRALLAREDVRDGQQLVGWRVRAAGEKPSGGRAGGRVDGRTDG